MDVCNTKDILIVQNDELAFCPERYKEYEPANYENIDICSFEYDLPELIKKDIRFYPHKPTVGETYAKSPFDKDVYVNISNLKDYIILEKFNCISDIARILGACKIEGSFCVQQVTERKWVSQTSGKYKIVECDLSVKKQEEERLNKAYKISNTSIGRNITIDDWRRAEKKAKEYNLISDPTVKNMLNALNPYENGGNHDISQDISFSVSCETNRALDIAFNLNSCAGIFKLNSEFQTATRYKYEIINKIHLEFPR